MNYDVYFHNDFDGRAAAAVVLAFLQSRGDDIEHYVPLKYDIIPQWLDENFFEKHKLFKGKRNPAIVVDFPFHPGAKFWFDHHMAPFRKKGWDKKFKQNEFWHYDSHYRSATALAYDSLREDFGWKPPRHLRELVKWLNVIDFADYRSPQQTIAMKEPAIQLNVFIENNLDNFAVTVETVKFLAQKALAQFIRLPHVKKRIGELRRMMKTSIAFHKEHDRHIDRVIVVDLEDDPTHDLAYFSPYALFPHMLYTVRLEPHSGTPSLYHINVGVNPWRRMENHKHIGKMLRNYGGGGHKDVGGTEIHGKAATQRAVDAMVKFLNKH